MIGWIRNGVLVFFLLSVVYIALTIMGRIKQKEKLKVEYDATTTELSKSDFIDRGMEAYNKSLRAKLVLGVYIVPLMIFGILVFLALNE